MDDGTKQTGLTNILKQNLRIGNQRLRNACRTNTKHNVSNSSVSNKNSDVGKKMLTCNVNSDIGNFLEHPFKFTANDNKSKKRIAPMTVKTNNYVIIDRKQNVENRKSDEVSGRNIAQETNNSIHVECSESAKSHDIGRAETLNSSPVNNSTLSLQNPDNRPDTLVTPTLKKASVRNINRDISKESGLARITTKHDIGMTTVGSNSKQRTDDRIKNMIVNDKKRKKISPEKNVKNAKSKFSKRTMGPVACNSKSPMTDVPRVTILSNQSVAHTVQKFKTESGSKEHHHRSSSSSRQPFMKTSGDSNEKLMFDNVGGGGSHRSSPVINFPDDKHDLKLRDSLFKTSGLFDIPGSDNSAQSSWYTPPSYFRNSFHCSALASAEKSEIPIVENSNFEFALDKSSVTKEGQAANQIIDKFIERCVLTGLGKESQHKTETSEKLIDEHCLLKNSYSQKLFDLMNTSSETLSGISHASTMKKSDLSVSNDEKSISSSNTASLLSSNKVYEDGKISEKTVNNMPPIGISESRYKFKPIEIDDQKLDPNEKHRPKKMLEVIKFAEKKLLELELRKEQFRVNKDNESIKALKKKQRAILLKVYANMLKVDKSKRFVKDWFTDDSAIGKHVKVTKENLHQKQNVQNVHSVSGCSSQYSDYKSTLSSDNTGSISASFNERLLPVNKHTMSEVGFGNKRDQKKHTVAVENTSLLLADRNEEKPTLNGTNPLFISDLSIHSSSTVKPSYESSVTHSAKESSVENCSLESADVSIHNETKNNGKQFLRKSSKNVFEILPCTKMKPQSSITITPKKSNRLEQNSLITTGNFKGKIISNVKNPFSSTLNNDRRKSDSSVHGSNISGDSVVISLNESTMSEQSDVELKISALQEQLNERKLEASRLRSLQKQLRRDQLKAQEVSLLKQIEAYDRYIQKVMKELSEANLSSSANATVIKPQIKKPQKSKFDETIKSFKLNYNAPSFVDDGRTTFASEMQDAETQFSLISETDYENETTRVKDKNLTEVTNTNFYLRSSNDKETITPINKGLNKIRLNANSVENKENYQASDNDFVTNDNNNVTNDNNNTLDDKLVQQITIVDGALNTSESDEIFNITMSNEIIDSVAANKIDTTRNASTATLPHSAAVGDTATEINDENDNISNLVNYIDDIHQTYENNQEGEEYSTNNSLAGSVTNSSEHSSEIITGNNLVATSSENSVTANDDLVTANDDLVTANDDLVTVSDNSLLTANDDNSNSKRMTDFVPEVQRDFIDTVKVINLPPFETVFNDIFMSQLHHNMTTDDDIVMSESMRKNLVGHVEYNPETESLLLKVEEIKQDLSASDNGVVITEYKSEENTSQPSSIADFSTSALADETTSDKENFGKTDDARSMNNYYSNSRRSSASSVTLIDEVITAEHDDDVRSVASDDDNISSTLVEELSSAEPECDSNAAGSEFIESITSNEEVYSSSVKIKSSTSVGEISEIGKYAEETTLKNALDVSNEILSEIHSVTTFGASLQIQPNEEQEDSGAFETLKKESSAEIPTAVSWEGGERNSFESMKSTITDHPASKNHPLEWNLMSTNFKDDGSVVVTTDLSLSFLDNDDDKLGNSGSVEDDIIEANWRDAKELLEEEEEMIELDKVSTFNGGADGTTVSTMDEADAPVSNKEVVIEGIDLIIAAEQSSLDDHITEIEETKEYSGYEMNMGKQNFIVENDTDCGSINSDLDSFETDGQSTGDGDGIILKRFNYDLTINQQSRVNDSKSDQKYSMVDDLKSNQQQHSVVDDLKSNQPNSAVDDLKSNQQHSVVMDDLKDNQQHFIVMDDLKSNQQHFVVDDLKNNQKHSIVMDDLKSNQQHSVVMDDLKGNQRHSVVMDDLKGNQQHSVVMDDLKGNQQHFIVMDDLKSNQHSVVDDLKNSQEHSIVMDDLKSNQQPSVVMDDLKGNQRHFVVMDDLKSNRQHSVVIGDSKCNEHSAMDNSNSPKTLQSVYDKYESKNLNGRGIIPDIENQSNISFEDVNSFGKIIGSSADDKSTEEDLNSSDADAVNYDDHLVLEKTVVSQLVIEDAADNLTEDKESFSSDETSTSREQDVSIEELIEDYSFLSRAAIADGRGLCMETSLLADRTSSPYEERFTIDTVVESNTTTTTTTTTTDVDNKRKFVEDTVETIISDILAESIAMKNSYNQRDLPSRIRRTMSFDMNDIGRILTENETPLLQALTRDQERQTAVKSAQEAENINSVLYRSVIGETISDSIRMYLANKSYDVDCLRSKTTIIRDDEGDDRLLEEPDIKMLNEQTSVVAADIQNNVYIVNDIDVSSFERRENVTFSEVTRNTESLGANLLSSEDNANNSTENGLDVCRNKYVEAERLRLEQLKIEQEIERIKSQHQHHHHHQIPPYVFFREIPNKPPPPYTPPINQDIRKIPDTKEEILRYVEIFVDVIYNGLQNGLQIDDIGPPADVLVAGGTFDCDNNDVDVYRVFLFDLNKELVESFYRRFNEHRSSASSLPWEMTKNNSSGLSKYRFLEKDKIDKETLTEAIKIEILSLFGLKAKIERENWVINWSKKKKTDYVDEILINELQQEEHEWVSYEQDELNIKNQITDDLLNELISDATSAIDNIVRDRNNDR